MAKVSRCGSCKRPVKWVETEGREGKPSKRMPLDALDDGTPVTVERGNVEFTGATAMSGASVVRVVATGAGPHVSHFATCPNAGKHRK